MSKKESKEKEETKKVKETETEKVEEEKTDATPEEKEPSAEEKLQKELSDTKEQLLRLTAEYANFRKRSEKEKTDSFTFAKAETVKEILPVFDNLERALASEQDDFDGLKKGVSMTFDGLKMCLDKLDVEVFGEPGDKFDPNLHNAVMHIESEDFGDGEIVDVFQKGYKINDKIIRPAMVKSAN